MSSGIDYDSDLLNKKLLKLDKVIEFYNEGKSQSYIEKELKMTRKTIREHIKKHKEISYRDKSEQQHIRCGTEINHNSFDSLTPESLYWIGFLYADGHVRKDKEYSIEFSLHKKDVNSVNGLKSFLGSNRKILDGSGKNIDMKTLKVNSKRIHSRLKSLGFTSDKSHDAVPHDLVLNSRDFWRGVIDGDGGLYLHDTNKTNHAFICGTSATIIEYIRFVTENLGVQLKIPTKAPGVYRVSYYGEEALQIARLLYKNSKHHLDRKYNTYLEWEKEIS